jgi:hypothetical protein
MFVLKFAKSSHLSLIDELLIYWFNDLSNKYNVLIGSLSSHCHSWFASIGVKYSRISWNIKTNQFKASLCKWKIVLLVP